MRRGLPPPQGLVAIPVSTFYSVPHRKIFDHYIRFCFVKVKDGVFEGQEGPLKLPAAHWWCGERGWTDLCWCRMSPHSRPWMRSCRNGRRSSGPDTTCSALPHLVPAGSARLCLCPGFSHSHVGRMEWGGGGLLWDTGCSPGRALFLDLGGFGSTLLQCLYSCPGGEVYLSQASPCSSLGGVIQSWAPSVFFPVLSEAQWTESNKVLALSPSPALAPAPPWPQPCPGPSLALAPALPFLYLTFTLGSGL